MSTPRRDHRSRALAIATLAALLSLVALPLMLGTGAAATTLLRGPDTVVVTPTSGLVDGQTLTIQFSTAAPYSLLGGRVHMCTPDAVTRSNGDFDLTPNCLPSDVWLSPGSDSEQVLPALAPGTRQASLTFRVGVGAAHWTTVFGEEGSLVTGADHPAQIVVEVASNDQTVGADYFSFPVTFAGSAISTTSLPTGPTSFTSTSTSSPVPPASPNTVSVTPIDGLVDGQVLTVRFTTAAPYSLLGGRVHICVPDVAIQVPADFEGALEPYCLAADTRLSPRSDAEQVLPALPPGATEATLAYRIGVGRAQWTTVFGDEGTLITGPGHPAQIVVEVRSTATDTGLEYVSFPVTFGPSPTTTAPTTTAPTTTAPTTPAARWWVWFLHQLRCIFFAAC